MIQNKSTLFKMTMALMFVLTCAKQMPPPGGPEDRTPPEVVKIVPEAGAINVSTHTPIEVVFSERMNRNTVEEAIFISPWPSEQIAFRWRGKKLRIEFGDTLKANRTYVVTIGAKSSDLRNNPLKNSFSMAFATGERIDEGQISGTVYSKAEVEGTLVCAYMLSDWIDPDPTKTLADYYTQCNRQGQYQLLYLAPGNYRLFAFRDRDGNRKYTRGIDAIGVANTDLELTATRKSINHIEFQLTVEDTIPPSLKSAYAIDQSHVVLRFSEELAAFDEHSPQHYINILANEDPSRALKILSCYQSSFEPANIFLLTDHQESIAYKVTVNHLTDVAGNSMDSLNQSLVFQGNSAPDTIKPRIRYRSVADSSQGIPLNAEIRLVFSEAMNPQSLTKGIVLKQEDQTLVSGRLNYNHPDECHFLTDSLLNGSTNYIVEMLKDSITDVSGNSLEDSLTEIHFKTLNKDTLSAIIGEIKDEQENASGKILLTAQSANNSYQITLDGPGVYRFENILPAIYTIHGFRDADSNGVYSFGRAFPYRPAERFFFYPDSIKVRSRWPNEGNVIIFK